MSRSSSDGPRSIHRVCTYEWVVSARLKPPLFEGGLDRVMAIWILDIHLVVDLGHPRLTRGRPEPLDGFDHLLQRQTPAEPWHASEADTRQRSGPQHLYAHFPLLHRDGMSLDPEEAAAFRCLVERKCRGHGCRGVSRRVRKGATEGAGGLRYHGTGRPLATTGRR